jgi:hypothetical protein
MMIKNRHALPMAIFGVAEQILSVRSQPLSQGKETGTRSV